MSVNCEATFMQQSIWIPRVPMGIWHLKISPVKVPTLPCTFVSESPLFPNPGGGNLLSLKSELPLSLNIIVIILWVRCEKAVRIPWVACGGKGLDTWLLSNRYPKGYTTYHWQVDELGCCLFRSYVCNVSKVCWPRNNPRSPLSSLPAILYINCHFSVIICPLAFIFIWPLKDYFIGASDKISFG